MSTWQQVIVIGRLGADPEHKQLSNNNHLARFNLAVTKRIKNRDPKTQWFTAVAFNATADVAMKFLKKGDLCQVIGEFSSSSYEKEGIRRTSFEVHVHRLILQPKREQKTQDEPYYDHDNYTDDIPYQ